MELLTYIATGKLEIFVSLALLVGGMIYYCYRPFDDEPWGPIPRDLLKDNQKVDDPFRSPEAMNRRLEDLGRNNVRANQGDGIIPELQIFNWFFKRDRGGRK
jgi:hypothetical protein